MRRSNGVFSPQERKTALWALLMAEQQPGPDYQALIDMNRQRRE